MQRTLDSIAVPFAMFLAVLFGSYSAPRSWAGEAEKPRLVVIVAFDQMRADYLSRWLPHLDRDGFGRLIREGAWYVNCRYPYANTMTAAGHASMATGCSPWKHGIVANSWYDRQLGKSVNAVHTARYPLVPLIGQTRRGAAPVRLKAETVGDELLKTHKMGKVVSISIKDRAAILLAGLLRALVLWFDRSPGMWVTSTYYRDNLPAWVVRYNKSRKADRWFGKKWERLRNDLDYAALSGPDDVSAEGNGYQQGQTFPHPTTGGAKKPGSAYYSALANSPFGNEMTLEMAKLAIDNEALGQDDIPDLLCVSFSSNDYVGHCWGPDSQEVLDITLRSDRLMADLLRHLDAKVGKGRYVVIVSADHGVCPLPEIYRARTGNDAKRFSLGTVKSQAEAHLSKRFGRRLAWIESTSSGMFYLNESAIRKAGLKIPEVRRELADWLERQPAIVAAFTADEIERGKAHRASGFFSPVRRSFYAANSGDVLPVIRPYWLPILLPKARTRTYTTTHGTPHDYDTHVPLLVSGAGIRPGVRFEAVTPQAVAVIAARALHIRPPRMAEVAVPSGLFIRD